MDASSLFARLVDARLVDVYGSAIGMMMPNPGQIVY
jgi:hypothetical protein